MTDYALRPAQRADAEAMNRVTFEGFESYRSFAPPGWKAPPREEELERLRELLSDPEVWYLVAERDAELVGHVGFLPASRARHAMADPGLAHFRQLFIARAHWGTGLATTLHAAAVDEAARRGFTAMRLFTPAGQARARRFYEREGWSVVETSDAPGLNGLDIAEYRRSLQLIPAGRGASPRRRPPRGR